MNDISLINSVKFAEAILKYLDSNSISISNLKLQKLIYYIQSWSIASFDKNQLIDELPQAWVNGPVYPNVYHNFKENRSEYIPISEQFSKLEDFQLNDKQQELIIEVLEAYAQVEPLNLVRLTHNQTPWINARIGLGRFEAGTQEIKKEDIYNYFQKQLKQ